jgi:hypothetical protein
MQGERGGKGVKKRGYPVVRRGLTRIHSGTKMQLISKHEEANLNKVKSGDFIPMNVKG